MRLVESNGRLLNYLDGAWRDAGIGEYLPVLDPATADVITTVPLGGGRVGEAVRAARKAFPGWRKTPPVERVQYLFKLKRLLEEQFEEVSRMVTRECGKTLAESRGEVRRGIENIEVAAGIPSLMMGYNLEDVASGIDETMIRQPVGVVAAITPFNFPAMIPLWFLPYAIACGNTFILKPSERVPGTANLLYSLIDQLGLPPGVLSLVNGGKEAVDALLEHPDVRAISFVGSSPVAKYVYAKAALYGKRAQCQGGAKNLVIVMPDADMESAIPVIAESAFGCAGQRCLAASIAVTVGDAHRSFRSSIEAVAQSRTVGCGSDPGVEMGPVISLSSKERICASVEKGIAEGAKLLVDGRQQPVEQYPKGNFIRPTILEDLSPSSELAGTEIFGPVLGITRVSSIDEAISLVNQSSFGNMACLFTSSGGVARKFRYEARAGNIGINVGVAAPMAFFPFSGWKESFFGDLHGQGRDAIEFYTEKKVVVERWPR